MSDYLAYQSKYRDTPRASDVELIRLISKHTPKNGRVLDVGCSTGNLLRHLKSERPDLTLAGCDADEKAVVNALADGVLPVFLEDATRQWRAPFDWPDYKPFDGVILNAVLYCLNDWQATQALRNIFLVLKPGGHLFIWDLLQSWNQRLTIREESTRYGDVTYNIRPWRLLHKMSAVEGFRECSLRPCKQPKLPKTDDRDDLTSWTKGGVAFRGGVAQPWCHAVLTK